jgi:hypothetical protein
MQSCHFYAFFAFFSGKCTFGGRIKVKSPVLENLPFLVIRPALGCPSGGIIEVSSSGRSARGIEKTIFVYNFF